MPTGAGIGLFGLVPGTIAYDGVDGTDVPDGIGAAANQSGWLGGVVYVDGHRYDSRREPSGRGQDPFEAQKRINAGSKS